MPQCYRCLAPLAAHQGRPVSVCDRCGAIQTGASPRVNTSAPTGGPAGFGPARRPSSAAPWVLLVGVLIAALAAGLVSLVVLRQRSIEAPGGGVVNGAGAGPAVGGSSVETWEDAARVKDSLVQYLGPGARVTEMLFYRDYVIVSAEEGEKTVHCQLRGGAWSRDDRMASPRSPLDKPGEAVLPLSDVDFSVVSAIVKEARERVQPASGEQTYVRLARHMPFVAEPLWTVYLGHGYADFNLRGKLVAGRTARGEDLEKQLANYFADATAVRDTLSRRFGPEVELTELALYSTYSIAVVRDPQQPENLDRYTIRPAGMSPGDPTRSPRGPSSSLFRMSALDFALIPRLAADANGRLRGAVTHILISKRGISVYVSDPRNSGYVLYGLDGSLKRVYD
ncbi:MAG: hypothetical protein R3B70_06675 [Polyangiaceae bacterium]